MSIVNNIIPKIIKWQMSNNNLKENIHDSNWNVKFIYKIMSFNMGKNIDNIC